MEEYEIFSQYIGNDSDLDSLFIKITSDQEISISSIKPISISMSEKLDRGTPSIIFDFVDGNGDLANHNLPQSGAIFFLYIGRSIIETKALKMRMTKMMSVNSTGGSERLTYRMCFVHHGWDKLIGQTLNRGWGDVNPSDVVKDIATECGWEKTIISPADGQMSVIQPNWTNVELIKWIADRCTTDNGRPRYSGRIDGTFLFKSIQSMIKDQKDLAMSGKIPLLRMEGQDGEFIREEGTKNNLDIPKYFTTYKINESHAQTRLKGGGGIKSHTYDSMTDTFMIDSWGVEDLDTTQMSDWTSNATDMTKSDIFLFNGRGSENKQEALSRISKSVDNSVELEITSEGSIDMRVGMMLEIIIPIPKNVGSNEPFNILYSGFWMISDVMHLVDLKKSTITTNTTLVRSGHDSKQLSGFGKTKGGKFVGGDQ